MYPILRSAFSTAGPSSPDEVAGFRWEELIRMFCKYPQGTSAQQPSSEAKQIGYHTGGFVSTLLAFHDDCENRFRQALGRLVGAWEIGKYTYIRQVCSS